ncbi:MAG: PilT/PilU family type 4a pilus ATPase [Lachnospiraceae bacterium]|nr:PilT/PilU family type 4a pilus ATPase [Lachnospiraceae bacterium]
MIDINQILSEARNCRASDIHLSVGAVPKFRIHGELKDSNFHKLSSAETLETLVNFMTHEQRDRFEAEGEIELSVSIRDFGRLRVNAYKQRGSITIALRLVDKEIPDTAQFSIPPAVVRLTEEKKGLIIMTGPSGSGKSSMLAAMIDRINSSRACNIITLEDPIEFLHKNSMSMINQREIGLDVKDYRTALKSALRADPDVLVVNRISGAEEASLVLTAAESGRLVFAAMSTNSVPETISSIVDIFPQQERTMARFRLADNLKAIVTRQLIHTSQGMSVPAYELLFMNGKMRELVRLDRSVELYEAIKAGADKDMVTMDQSLTELVQSGTISAEEAVEAALDPEALARDLGVNL